MTDRAKQIEFPGMPARVSPPALDAPESYQLLADAIGGESADRLVAALGGTTYHVPQVFPLHHPIVMAVGAEAAQALSALMAGEKFSIPKMAAATQARRNAQIRAGYDAGATTNQLALDYGLTERYIRHVLGLC